jgi:amino acid transporter
MADDRTLEELGYQDELHRGLSTWDLVVYGLVFIMPIAPMGIYGFVATESHGMPVLTYVVCTIGILFTALAYREMARAVPTAGSIYGYASKAFGSRFGFLAGWMILIDYLLIPSLCYVFAAIALAGMISAVPLWAWLALFAVVNTAINYRGVVLSARFNRVVLGFQFATVALFLGFGITAVSTGAAGEGWTARPIWNPAELDVSALMTAASIAVLSFLGFDAISTLSEEAEGGGRSAGRATLLALFVVAGFFMVQTFVAGNLQPDWRALAADPDNGFYDVAAIAGGRFLYTVCAGMTAFSWGITAAQASQAAVSRVLFSMARDRLLPAPLARIHPRFRTPSVALLSVAAISVVIAFLYRSDPSGITYLVNFGALTGFLCLHASVVRHYLIRHRSRNFLVHLVVPLLGAVVIGYVWWGLDPKAKLLGLGWVVAGAIILAINVGRGIRTKLDV